MLVKPGDKVKVKTKDDEFSGIMMPSTKKNIVVLKFESGYNMGIEKKKIKKMTLVKKGKKMKKDSGVVRSKKGLPNVTILATGGTISSKIDYRTGAVHPAVSARQLTKDIPEMKKIANVKCLEIMNKLSENINLSDWKKIAKAIYNELVDEEVSGVVVMHGTDTMHYTSAAISFMLKNLNKPVVFTGSQRSSDRGSSDAKMNLLCAVHLAVSNLAEVMVCMHGNMSDKFCLAHRGTKVRKMHTSRRDAFQSINKDPIAEVSQDGKIKLISGGKRRDESEPALDAKGSQKAALVYVHGNADPKILNWYIKAGYKGIILAGTGLGHVPSRFISAIKKAVKTGASVFMTSQCLYGRVNSHVYSSARETEKAGVTYLEDMLPETALVKLMWSMGKSNSRDEIRKIMLKNVAGEIQTRTDIDQKIFK